MNELGLFPCPGCGSAKAFVSNFLSETHVACEECKMRGPEFKGGGFENASKAALGWNALPRSDKPFDVEKALDRVFGAGSPADTKEPEEPEKDDAEPEPEEPEPEDAKAEEEDSKGADDGRAE